MDNKWIPTSERLPEVDKYGEAYVLVCMDDECKGYEFINWITGKHEEFRKSIGLDKYTPYTKEQEKIFLKFINGSR